jgi:hypothetical protein
MKKRNIKRFWEGFSFVSCIVVRELLCAADPIG